MKNWIKHAVASVAGGTVLGAAALLPSESFIAFVIGWLFLIPAAVVVYLAFGLRGYRKDKKNRIMVTMKPSEAMKALARREAELKKERNILYEEFRKG